MRYKNKIKVFCKECKEWYYEEEVEYRNIEEDMQGADILTFKCKCGKISKSKRYG